MKITTNTFTGILVALMTASMLLSFTGVTTGNPPLYFAGFALFISIAPVIALHSWLSHRANDNSQEE